MGNQLSIALAVAVPSVVVLLLTVVTIATVLVCIKWRKHTNDGGAEYDTVDYFKPPTLPPRQLPNVAYHTRTELELIDTEEAQYYSTIPDATDEPPEVGSQHGEVCVESNIAYQPAGRANTSDEYETVGETANSDATSPMRAQELLSP